MAEDVLGDHRPQVWVSDRYAVAQAHQVCLGHVLRDIQYAIDSGDTVVSPKDPRPGPFASGNDGRN